MDTPLELLRPTLGVSACLLGHSVRYDGGHKRDAFLAEVAPRFFDIVPFCPEMGLGLGCPRPTIQLRRYGDRVRLVDSRTPFGEEGLDYTERMFALAEGRLERFRHLDGLVVKKSSPSCGLERVAVVVNPDGLRERNGEGVFTAAIRRHLPFLPVEEEGRLQDPLLREAFLERVFALHRWRQIPEQERNVAEFLEFHARHKLLLMARGPHCYAELGRIAAGTTLADLAERRERYLSRFMAVMALRPERSHQINVLQHILGFFKQVLDSEDKQELLRLFEAYRNNRLSLASPLILLRHHLRRSPHPWLASQYYLAPYPDALALPAP